MTTTDKPEIPLTEAIAPALAFARQSLDVGAMAAFNAVLAIAPSYDALIRQQEARIAELEAELAKFRELAREAREAGQQPDIDTRYSCWVAWRDIVTRLIQRLAALHKEAASSPSPPPPPRPS